MTASPAAALAPRRDGVLLALAALAIYLLLAQEALHGLDVHVHVFFLSHGRLEHPFHLLYMQIIGAAWPPLRALGLGPHHAIRLLSALGMALWVYAAHRTAARLSLSRRDAALLAALCAVPPAVVFFATVPEIHGLFSAFAGLAWWVWARLLQVPSVPRALALGATTALAASVHATGHLLFGLCAAGALGQLWPRPPWRALCAGALAHAAGASLIAWALRPARGGGSLADQVAFLRDYAADPHAWSNVGRVVVDEWFLAFAPMSVLVFAGLAVRGARPFAVFTTISLLVYLGCAYALLDEINERGAYLLPLALPAAWLTLRAFGHRTALVAAAVSLGLAIAQVVRHDHVAPADWVQGLVELAGPKAPGILCRDVDEQAAITRALPEAPFVRVDSLMATADRGEAALPEFCAMFDGLVQQFEAQGRATFITAAAYETMLGSGRPFFARFLHEHVEQRFAVERVSRRGFTALRVRSR